MDVHHRRAGRRAGEGGNVTPTSATPAVSIAPMLSVRRGAQALEFYKQAFDAEEIFKIQSPDGAVVAQLAVHGAAFWVADESPAHQNFSPESLNGSTARFVLVVADPDVVFAQALAAGGQPIVPVGERHGWYMGRLVDPYGHHWEIGKPIADGVGR